jgi:RNA processing factor Prp31
MASEDKPTDIYYALERTNNDISTYTHRLREWYGWHFPELSKYIDDDVQYARLLVKIGNRALFCDEKQAEINDIVHDTELTQKIINAAPLSMGVDIHESDMESVNMIANQVLELVEFRENLLEIARSITNEN